MSESGAQFLHDRDPKYHATPDVEMVYSYLRQNGERIPNNGPEKIVAYLGFLAEVVNDGILTGDEDSIDYQIDAHRIKPDEVPDSYFDLQRRIAKELGHGDLEITADMRAEAARVTSEDQRHSLKPWALYLSGPGSIYPDWFRLYAFDSMLRLGRLDKERGEFTKRSNLTVTPYPELSRGGLAKMYEWITTAHVEHKPVTTVFGDEMGERYDSAKEARIQKALKKGNFSSLYAAAIEATKDGIISEEQLEIHEGSWRKYDRGSDPDKLHSDLQGFGLDWCTATGLETTTVQLKGGDFYVFYTQDQDEVERVPRIAVRMEQGFVAEVRGILPGQELEPEMIDTATAHIRNFPGGPDYMQRASDMKRLTAIDNKLSKDPDAALNAEELRFLYEIGHTIEGFGYDHDPRIDQIRKTRDIFADYAVIFDVPTEHVTGSYEITPETEVVIGSISLMDMTYKLCHQQTGAGPSWDQELTVSILNSSLDNIIHVKGVIFGQDRLPAHSLNAHMVDRLYELGGIGSLDRLRMNADVCDAAGQQRLIELVVAMAEHIDPDSDEYEDEGGDPRYILVNGIDVKRFDLADPTPIGELFIKLDIHAEFVEGFRYFTSMPYATVRDFFVAQADTNAKPGSKYHHDMMADYATDLIKNFDALNFGDLNPSDEILKLIDASGNSEEFIGALRGMLPELSGLDPAVARKMLEIQGEYARLDIEDNLDSFEGLDEKSLRRLTTEAMATGGGNSDFYPGDVELGEEYEVYARSVHGDYDEKDFDDEIDDVY